MNIKDLLPIGSVVLLKNAKKPLMIFGVKQFATEHPDQEYDYIGVLYPEGNMGAEFQFLFNHEDIVEVYFRGYETEERERFIQQLVEVYDAENSK